MDTSQEERSNSFIEYLNSLLIKYKDGPQSTISGSEIATIATIGTIAKETVIEIKEKTRDNTIARATGATKDTSGCFARADTSGCFARADSQTDRN